MAVKRQKSSLKQHLFRDLKGKKGLTMRSMKASSSQKCTERVQRP